MLRRSIWHLGKRIFFINAWINKYLVHLKQHFTRGNVENGLELTLNLNGAGDSKQGIK